MKHLRIAATLIAVPLVLSMAACSNNSPQSPATTGATETPTGPVEIAYSHRLPDGEGMTKVADIVKKWNDSHPDIQVKTTKFDGNAQQMVTRLETDIKANNGPCLAQLGYNEIPDMYNKGLLEDVSTEAAKYKANYTAAYDLMTVDGKTVGLPQDTGPLVYLYNATEFENLGIKLPATLADFQTAAATAAAQGKYIADFTADETGYWLSAQTAAAGGSWYGVSGGAWKVTVQSAAAKTVADFWQKMLDDKTVLTYDRWADTYSKAMTDGQLIGNIAAAWEVAFALDAVDGTPYEGQWRVAQIPDFGAGAKTGPDGGSGVAVMKGCQYPAQAMEFNDWFNTQVDDLFSQGLVTAATKAPTKTPEKMTRQFGGQDIIPVLATANKNMPQNFVYIPGMGSVVPQIVTAATDVVAGNKKVSEVFDAGQTASVTALKDLGLKSTEG